MKDLFNILSFVGVRSHLMITKELTNIKILKAKTMKKKLYKKKKKKKKKSVNLRFNNLFCFSMSLASNYLWHMYGFVYKNKQSL